MTVYLSSDGGMSWNRAAAQMQIFSPNMTARSMSIAPGPWSKGILSPFVSLGGPSPGFSAAVPPCILSASNSNANGVTHLTISIDTVSLQPVEPKLYAAVLVTTLLLVGFVRRAALPNKRQGRTYPFLSSIVVLQ